MRAGRVASIRINPKDCMAIVDMLEISNLNIKGMSFAQAVSTALSCAMEVFRSKGIIPTRDGFEYTKLMSAFPESTKGFRARQYEIQDVFNSLGSDITYPQPNLDIPNYENHPNTEVRLLNRRMVEMLAQREVDPENFDEALYETLLSELNRITI